jgi:hypothetical protein
LLILKLMRKQKVLNDEQQKVAIAAEKCSNG